MAYRIPILLTMAVSLAACVATEGSGDRGITTTPYESHYTYECRLRGLDPETAAFRTCVNEVRLERLKVGW